MRNINFVNATYSSTLYGDLEQNTMKFTSILFILVTLSFEVLHCYAQQHKKAIASIANQNVNTLLLNKWLYIKSISTVNRKRGYVEHSGETDTGKNNSPTNYALYKFAVTKNYYFNITFT
ncbi:hypothetical protein HN014_21400 [Aquimarina sp. TRL1]|uniref:hypothetical protein n=1 Tax=Aquimarina sp. (strain TRL1) TaxID=2736252 RepID=UPI0015891611|nr:hypothetical protein [Aquimarina sp. TRL1]QKX07360.1 hypothetical protein HN014_21400 [Aquimarina sp. TRL1]